MKTIFEFIVKYQVEVSALAVVILALCAVNHGIEQNWGVDGV